MHSNFKISTLKRGRKTEYSPFYSLENLLKLNIENLLQLSKVKIQGLCFLGNCRIQRFKNVTERFIVLLYYTFVVYEIIEKNLKCDPK